jgi:hypothetical protein
MRVYRLAFAALPLVAIGATLVDLATRGTLDIVNVFSYFTIQSNLIGVAAFLLTATIGRDRPFRVDMVRGAALTYLIVTFVVFALLLSDADVNTPLAWVDFILHKVFPVAVMIDWILDPPLRRIPLRLAMVWLAYPLVWVGYALIRGALVGWYPYPFLDPANGGYASVAAYVVAILIFGIVVSGGVAAIGNALRGRRATSVPSDSI